MKRIALAGLLSVAMAGVGFLHAQPPETIEDEYLQALIAKREETQRDNALIYYQKASLLFPGAPSQEEDPLIRDVLRNGWSEESEALIPYLRSWEPAFDLIREGVALDHAYGIGYDLGRQTPTPNFLAIQLGARMLTVEGRRQESLGNLDRAIEEYSTALHMSRDIGSEGNRLISSLISIANQHVVLLALRDMITGGGLDAAQLARVQEMLQHIEDTHAGVASGMEGERAAIVASLVKGTERILAASDEELAKEMAEFTEGLEEVGVLTRLEMVELLELTRHELDAYWQKSIEQASHEPYKAGRLDYAELIAEMKSPLARQALPNITEASTRDYTMIARRRLALTETALELYRLGHDRYPASLYTLNGVTIRQLPIDPFSGSAMRYRLGGDGEGYTLYSLGPDKTDSAAGVTYDPTNGTISPGNIY